MELRSIRKIYSGEEITVSYISPLNSASERQEELRRRYNFICKCRVCRKSETEKALSDQRRMSIDFGWMPQFYEKIWNSREPDLAKRTYASVLSDIDQERLYDYRYTHLRGLTQVFAALGDEKNTLKFAKEAKDACKIAIDGKSLFRDYTLWDECIRNVETHPNWKNWCR